MTFLDLLIDMHRECGVSGPRPTDVVNAQGELDRLAQWLLQAEDLILNKWQDWKFLWGSSSITTVPGVSDYAGPDDLAKYDHETFCVDSKGFYGQTWEYDKWKECGCKCGDTAGCVQDIIILPNNQLRVNPAPAKSQVIRFDYWKRRKLMAAKDSVSLIPEQFRKIILYRAMILYGNHENAPEVKAQGQEGYAELLIPLQSHQLPNEFGMHHQSSGNFIQVVGSGS